ncbi:MAG: tRNA lysidine(34) synthetase TilS [Bacteroidetes bacterium]|nr:tRNA lysidine(34) synthetase TilS [Bacteroidota bacterium]MBS1540881.1 tRNA lysidine(34) synthetase TilS [Bacteroidota bacterium]
MDKAFVSFIQQKKLCTAHDNVLLAVSGGKDSMAMLHLFINNGFRVSVAHVNFQLRGRESAEDERFVKKFCHLRNIPFYTIRFDTKLFAQTYALSTQMAARELRYNWFDELIEQHHFSRLATAHHVNDSLETVLLNITRGTGAEGLDGIAPKNGNRIRPLLFATREQIDEYLKKNKIRWREDSSNATQDYHRNFLRHQVIPKLKKLNPSLEDSFTNSVEKIAADQEMMAEGLRLWKKKYVSSQNGKVYFLKEGFATLTNAAGVLWRLIKDQGFHLDQCKQIIRALPEQSGKKFLSHNFELVVDRKHLIVSPIEKEESPTFIRKGQTKATHGKLLLKISKNKKKKIVTHRLVAQLDSAKVVFPVIWRNWKEGDFFYPLGMDHKKKISDFLTDLKIPVSEKEKITVIESAGEIAWVVGYRLSQHFKITDSTSSVVQLELK